MFKIMPETVDLDLDKIEEEAKDIINDFGGEVGGSEKEPVAFGLMCLKISMLVDESKSNLDPIEERLRKIEGVISAEVVDVRRAIG